MQRTESPLVAVENRIHSWLVAYSTTILRVAVGAIFLGFGVLKFFPGVSPAENLVMATTDKLTLGLVPGGIAIVAVAILECTIGLCLLAGRPMRIAVWLLLMQGVGILAPLVLLPARLFAGPHHAPTLEGQYVLKDFILVAAGMVIAAASFRGARMIRDELPQQVPMEDVYDADQRFSIVLSAMTDSGMTVADVCAARGISEATYCEWREAVVDGAVAALEPVPVRDGGW